MKYFITTTFLFLVFSATFAQKNYGKSFNEDCVPSDLKSKGHILIVRTPFLESDEKDNAEIKDIFEKNYTGKFVVVPAQSKDFDNKMYDNKKIYKYSISMLQTKDGHTIVEPNVNLIVEHTNYELSIIDRSKLTKEDFDPHAIKDSIMKNNGGKKPTLEDYKKMMKPGDLDNTAIHKTGLEDDQSKLKAMLVFLAKKLEAFSD